MLNKFRGFTMIELLIVIAIIGLLLAVVLPNISAVRRRSQDEKKVADLGLVETALHEYRRLCKVYPMGISGGTVDLNANNGLPGINNGKCNAITKFSSLLPSGFVLDGGVRYYALVRGVGGTTGRCSSFHLGVTLSSAEAAPIKRMATRGWKWKEQSEDIFKWKICGPGSLNGFGSDVYDVISPSPY